MSNTTYVARQRVEPDTTGVPPLQGPLPAGWRECTLTRAKEIETLCEWVLAQPLGPDTHVFAKAIAVHVEAARRAATDGKAGPPGSRRRYRHRDGPLRERAMSNLDAAEADLLNIAPAQYVLGQLPSLLEHVQCHLVVTDPRRREFERIARRLGMNATEAPTGPTVGDGHRKAQLLAAVEDERGKIASITRAASSAGLREQVRVRSFRNIVVWTAVVMGLLAVVVAVIGAVWPTLIPLCFAPQAEGTGIVVCPTKQSAQFSTAQPADETAVDIDVKTAATAQRYDLAIVELVGLIAATVAAASSIRKIRGSSERYHLPLAMTVLKLPTGAITAFLGLLLMRGQFVPGLSALDTSAQILAWALVFGYAQQLFTQAVDRQGQSVLNSVRGADKPRTNPDPPPPPPVERPA